MKYKCAMRATRTGWPLSAPTNTDIHYSTQRSTYDWIDLIVCRAGYIIEPTMQNTYTSVWICGVTPIYRCFWSSIWVAVGSECCVHLYYSLNYVDDSAHRKSISYSFQLPFPLFIVSFLFVLSFTSIICSISLCDSHCFLLLSTI